MKATQKLEQEHRTIERVASACGVFAEMINNGTAVPTTVLQKTVAFLRVYCDQAHQEKEKWLFGVLRGKGVPDGSCPIAVLKHEDHKLAMLVDQLAAAVDAYAKSNGEVTRTLTDTLDSLAELYRDHIWKEDYLLLPMAEKLFSDDDQRFLANTFCRIDANKGADAQRAVNELSAALKTCAECNPPEKHQAA